MRILHVVPNFYPAIRYGGPIYSVLHLCLQLEKLGCDVKVLTTDANGDYSLTPDQRSDGLLGSLKVQFCHRIGKGMVAPGLLPRLSAAAEWADLIHLTYVYDFPTLPTLFSAQIMNKPLVWSPRGTLQRWADSRRLRAKAIWESVCRTLMPKRTTLHATSEKEAQESAPRLGNPPTAIIPNGIDIPDAVEPSKQDGVLKLLFVGRLDPKKGIENLILASSMLTSFGVKDWQLNIVGDGNRNYIDKLRRLACVAEFASRIHFPGHLEGEKKRKAFANCDILVAPSYTENFGLVIAEALAHARPVIASQGTPWSGVEEHACGVWVPNDPKSLAAAITNLSRSDRSAMGQRGRDWMTKDFSWQDRARRMLSLYEAVA